MELTFLLKPWVKNVSFTSKITGLSHDSRQIKPGFLFLAYGGAHTDGRLYIEAAYKAGAAAILYDPQNCPEAMRMTDNIPCIPLSNLSGMLAKIASRFYENPSASLSVTGVTGTNGKTTIAYQLTQAHELLGRSARYIGTIGQGSPGALQPLQNTTPDALCLQRLCHDYFKAGVSQVCMEVSSHALTEGRVDEFIFNQAIFTNLTQDHLDYHQTMAAYAKAKARLFAYPDLKYAILNHDDPYTAQMSANCSPSCQKLTYGLQPSADVYADNCDFNMHGSVFNVYSPWGETKLHIKSIGAFNVYNSLAIFSSLMAYGYPLDKVVSVMGCLTASPGRMEIVSTEPSVIVDYAHTPDALEKALATLATLKRQHHIAGHIWVVFGCGGDRDKGKRPMMGRVASQWADHVILTSDNPRTEDPAQILKEIAAGLEPTKNTHIMLDRQDAIQHALKMAGKDDIVLIAGKGHESYQEIGRERHAFSDQDVVKTYLHLDS